MPTAKTGLQFEYFYALSLHCNEKNAHLIFTAFVIHGFCANCSGTMFYLH